MTKLNILMLYPGIVDELPPLLSASICMAAHGAKVTVMAIGCRPAVQDKLLGSHVELVSLGEDQYPASALSKIMIRIRFALLLRRNLEERRPNVLWFHGGHAMAYRFYCNTKNTILIIAHAHEIYDNPRLRHSQNVMLRTATLYIVPECNRGWLLKTSARTNAPFFVVPNRLPLNAIPANVDKSYAAKIFSQHGGASECTQFFIYQGLFASDRCLLELLNAFILVPDKHIGLILLGSAKDQVYETKLRKLASRDDRVVIVPRISPPEHLQVTMGCFAGIILYAPTSLNNIYCAPNKLYEFAYYGLGMIMPGYPGFISINKQFDLGELCDPKDPESIAKAIRKLLMRSAGQNKTAAERFLLNTDEPDDIYRRIYSLLNERVKMTSTLGDSSVSNG